MYGISTTPPVPHQTPPKPKARFSEISDLVKSARLLELVSFGCYIRKSVEPSKFGCYIRKLVELVSFGCYIRKSVELVGLAAISGN